MRRYIRKLFVLTALGTLMAVGNVRAQDQPTCYLSFQMENQNRHIVGDVNAECSGGCTLEDTDPWGNWGVDSNFGTRNDTTQFRGWKYGDSVAPCFERIGSDRPQWNSCSMHTSRGDSYYYNYPNGVWTEQWGNPNLQPDPQSYASAWLAWGNSCPIDSNHDGIIESGGCGVGTRSFTASNQYMHLYEMDPIGDDGITTLSYPSGCCTAQFACDGWSCGGGSSPWYTNNASVVGTAQIRLVVIGAEWDDPDGCCIDGVNYCRPGQLPSKGVSSIW